MSAQGESKKRIVIKRPIHEEDGHGGQWKIAYADFVTAMMAFFLIMWLLNTVNEKQKLGLARYFNATSIMDMRSGDGVMDGSHSALDGAESKMTPISESHDEDTAEDASDQADAGGAARRAESRTDRQRLDAVAAEVQRLNSEGKLGSAQNVSVDVTPEGLRIQVFDRDTEAMFAPGSAEPNPRLAAILGAIAPVLGGVRNGVVVSGYTDNQPLPRAGYGNWELSADRANGARRVLEANGLASTRFVRVEGRGATDPLLPQSPTDPRNRRIALTLLRASAAPPMPAPAAAPRRPAGTP
jgi:chemotaxis protein MotB